MFQIGRPEPCRPISRLPGVQAVIPRSRWTVQLFPTLLRLTGPHGEEVMHPLPIRGAVHEWTAQLDLECGEVRVWGRAQDYFLFRINRLPEGITLIGERAYASQHLLVPDEACGTLAVGSPSGPAVEQPQSEEKERLQFGAHAIHDVDRLRVNPVLAQLLPAWFLLGEGWTVGDSLTEESSLLGQWTRQVAEANSDGLSELLTELWRSGFSGLWHPHARDTQFWGNALPPTQGNPWALLAAGRHLLRQMAMQWEGDKLTLLPCMPAILPAGRLLHSMGPSVLCSLEWTKRTPRRLWVQAKESCSLQITWKGEPQARLQRLQNRKREPFQQGTTLQLVKGEELLIDRFSKA